MGVHERAVICVVGGGSAKWSPKLLTDILLEPTLDGAEVRLLDLDLPAASRIRTLMEGVAARTGRRTTFLATDDPETAYRGAHYVIITINTGGLDAMAADLEIPEKYGIYHTVGDTVGPGGWSRAIRNVPVFQGIAAAVERWCDDPVLINYSNPMAVLTQTLCESTRARVTGLCHGIQDGRHIFRTLFDVDEGKVKITFGGTNHFWFVTDVRIDGRPGYPMLRELLGSMTLADYLGGKRGGSGLNRDVRVLSELYHRYGALAYPQDRHICEFVPGYINAGERRLEEYRLLRTPLAERRVGARKAIERVERWIAGKETFDRSPSGETAAPIIAAIEDGRDLVEDYNLANRGQIPNLPKGVVVETLGHVSTLGFLPSSHGDLPESIAALTLPHCRAQQLLQEWAHTGDRELAWQALAGDPLCSHLTERDKRALYTELWTANTRWLPERLRARP